MSGHEHERLSAYLDGELTPAARAAVAAHLEACGECRERLAELRAVSEAASALPSEAPPGYFEALPGRVRARLEPRGARRARSLPAWTWAAAAALLLAVVTPLTLQRRSAPAPSAPPPASPPLQPAAAPPPARADSNAPAASEARAASGAARDELAKPAPAPGRPASATPPVEAPPPAKRELAFARSPSEADTQAPGAVAQTREAVAAPPQPGVLADATAASGAAMPQARNQATAFEEKLVDKKAADASRDEREERDEVERPAPAEPQAADALASRGRPSAAPLGATAVAGGAGPSSRQAEWGRLDAEEPRTAAEWRRLREGWLAFVARDPAGPRADAARVRGIEAALAAWRASLDPADEALFRRDAAAYLERTDARQKEHVRRLLVPGRP